MAMNHGLKGRALEQATASFIDNGINIGDLNYVQEAYSDFLFHFPNSAYTSHLEKVMAPYFSSQSIGKEEETVFEPVSAINENLKDILSKHKGRVVYIDLWGTWCGPCRQEFLFSKPMKVYFAGKPVDFLYIAFEHPGINPEIMWKKTVKFYKITGRHILATDKLKEDIDKYIPPVA